MSLISLTGSIFPLRFAGNRPVRLEWKSVRLTILASWTIGPVSVIVTAVYFYLVFPPLSDRGVGGFFSGFSARFRSTCLDLVFTHVEKGEKYVRKNGETIFSFLKPVSGIVSVFDPDGFDEISGPDRTLDCGRKNADPERFERLRKVHIENARGDGGINDRNERACQP